MDRRIYIVGETTYDIIFKDEKPLEAKVGGSQLNSAVSLGRIGLPISFISITGNDHIGQISRRFLTDNKVDSQFVLENDDHSRVALAFLDEKNNAEYTFLNPVKQEINFSFPEITKDDIVLFGSSFAIKKSIREQLYDFLLRAQKKGAIIVYDPNFRTSNRPKLDELMPMLVQNFEIATIVKGSDEDFYNILNVQTSKEAHHILADYNVQHLLYTAGSASVKLHTPVFTNEFQVPRIQPVSTIGAGDNFNAGIIYSLFKLGLRLDSLESTDASDWKYLVNNSIKFAQHVCQLYDNYIDHDFAHSLR